MRLLAITTEPDSPHYERFIDSVKTKRTRLIGITGRDWTFGLAFIVRGKPKPKPPPPKPKPHWEVVFFNDDDEVYRVRWSEPMANGEYLYVAKYPDGYIGREEAEKQAREWNRGRNWKRPEHFREWRDAESKAEYERWKAATAAEPDAETEADQ